MTPACLLVWILLPEVILLLQISLEKPPSPFGCLRLLKLISTKMKRLRKQLQSNRKCLWDEMRYAIAAVEKSSKIVTVHKHAVNLRIR